ncbi:MAG: PfkB family carbohydrate kinase [Verrucomicrobiales bacterium]|nr:PfkB family carbohydrate kinase [Verrucomicrobiales bacterium]
MSKGILGIGVCTLDILTHTSTFPLTGDVEEANDSLVMGGGPVATALAAAASMGSKTTMLDRLGDDWRSRLILDGLEGQGVSCDEIKREPGARASLASVWVRAADGARAIRFVRSSASPLLVSEIKEEILTSHRFIHCNGRHLEACMRAAEICRNSGGQTQLSFDGGANRYRDELIPLMKATTIAIVALEFAMSATGAGSRQAAAKDLQKLCPQAQIVGITDGENGSWLYLRDAKHFHQPAYPVAHTVDTTGCGDVYHGAFLHALDSGRNVKEAAQIASASGALNATALGGRGRLPTREDVEQVIRTG